LVVQRNSHGTDAHWANGVDVVGKEAYPTPGIPKSLMTNLYFCACALHRSGRSMRLPTKDPHSYFSTFRTCRVNPTTASTCSSAVPVEHVNVDTQGLYVYDTLSSPLDCNSHREAQKHGHEHCCRRHPIEDKKKAGVSWVALSMSCEHKRNKDLVEVGRSGEVHEDDVDERYRGVSLVCRVGPSSPGVSAPP